MPQNDSKLMDNHREARAIFHEMQSRPYAVTEVFGKTANNCYYKGIELIQRLSSLGYAVRGRAGETYWDAKLIPADILQLYPRQHLVTHFFVEAEIDGAWWTLDPSIDPALEKYGFQAGRWSEIPSLCFPITKLYNQDEQIAHVMKWNDPSYVQSYFADAGTFLKKLNAWLDDIRKKDM